MTKHFGATLSALALAGVLSGCAGGSGTTPPASTAGPTAGSAAASASSTSAPATSAAAGGSGSGTAATAADLKTAATKAGQVVVDAKGMSVYFYTKDTKDSGTSACTGSCIAAWPPVLSGSDTPSVEGVSGKVGTIATPEGKKQLTVNGMPVYYYFKDRAPGDITGQGVGSVWYLVDPAGEMITSAAGSGY